MTMTAAADDILIGKAEGRVALNMRFANRHGLIAGATGTGKTITLQTLAEGFAARGVPVFLADVKGDLSGLCTAGSASGKLAERAKTIGLDDYAGRAFPTIFWDVFGEQGHPIRATVSELGPLLLSRLLDLNDIQEGVLTVAFALADDQGLLLLDLKDLRAMLTFVADNSDSLRATYGNVSATTVGAIQRKLLSIERQGGEAFFGEPSLDIHDLMRTDRDGIGYISILAADKLYQRPRLYSTFLLWLLSELFESLPEVGDVDRPKLVFFFDEAHLLFDDAPKALLDKVEQVVRLIRSKGVGVYFITQNPTDLPDDVLSQLGNRVQHALRAFTAKDQKAVRAAAETFRPNPKFDAQRVVTELAVGEALVSTLEDKGTPSIVQRTLIRPPASWVGPAPAGERARAEAASPVAGRYDMPIDRLSAYEHLKQRADEAARAQAEVAAARYGGATAAGRRPTRRAPASIAETLVTSASRTIGNRLGREIVRGVLGSLFRGR
jgi:DNA helicase HerA-like ATPase